MPRILGMHFVFSIIGLLTVMLQWMKIGEMTQIIVGVLETILVSIGYLKIGRAFQYERNKNLKTILCIFSLSIIIVLGVVLDAAVWQITGATSFSSFSNFPFMPLFAMFQKMFYFEYDILVFILLGMLPSSLILLGYVLKR